MSDLSQTPELFTTNATASTTAQPERPSFWQDMKNNYFFSYGNTLARFKESIVGKNDPDFKPTASMILEAPPEIRQDIIDSNSQREVDFYKRLYEKNKEVREQLDRGRISAMLASSFLDPSILLPLPSAKGMKFWDGVFRVAAGTASFVGATEYVRSKNDPFHSPGESADIIVGSALLGGVLGGGVSLLTRNRTAKNFDNATNYQEGRTGKGFDEKYEDIKPNALFKGDTYRGKTKQPKFETATTKQIFEENGFEYKFKTKEAEEAFKKNNRMVLPNITETLGKVSPVIRNITRFPDSQIAKNTMLSLAGDGGQYMQATKKLGLKSFINPIGGTVLTNSLTWVGKVANLKLGLRSDYMKFHNIDKPLTFADIHLGYAIKDYQQQGKNFVDKLKGRERKAVDEDTFNHMIGQSMVDAEINGGKMLSDIPEVEAGTRKMTDFFREFEVAGDEVGFFTRTKDFDNVEKFILQDIDKLYKRISEINKLKTKDFTDGLRANNAFETLESKITDFEFLNINYQQLARKQKNAPAELDALSEEYMTKILTSREAPKRFKRRYTVENIEESIQQRIKQSYNSMLERLKFVDDLLHSSSGLDDVFAKERNILLDLIQDVKERNVTFPTLPKGYNIIIGKNKTKSGIYVGASHNRKAKLITLDEEFIKGTMFREKRWTKPRLEGVEPLPSDQFKTSQEWFDFVKMHEIKHALNPRLPGESTARYENRINKLALDDITKQYSFDAKKYKTVIPKDNVQLLKSDRTKIPESFYREAVAPTKIDFPTFFRYYDLLNKNMKRSLDFKESKIQYFPRNHITEAYYEHRDTAVSLYKNHYLNNPTGKLAILMAAKRTNKEVEFPNVLPKEGDTRKTVTRVPDEEDINKRAEFEAEKTINKIINESVRGDIDGSNTGMGQAKYALRRKVDIPNHILTKKHNGVADFIHLNVETVARNYSQKVGPAIEAARMFRGDRNATMEINEMLDDILIKYRKEANSNPEKMTKDLRYQADDFVYTNRIVQNKQAVESDMSTPANQGSRILMNSAHITMMGAVVPASLADAVKVVLTRGFKEVFGRYFRSWARDTDETAKMLKSNKWLVESTGVGIENVLNNASRMKVESPNDGGVGYKRAMGKYAGKIVDELENATDKLKDKFYNMTLLNEWTSLGKKMILPMAADRIIRTGAVLAKAKVKVPEGKKFFDLDYQTMLAIGLDKEDLIEIYRLWAKHNGNNEFKGKLNVYYDNHVLWMDENPILARKYLSAIRMEVINTYITPTIADKPLFMEGVATYSRLNKKLRDHQATYYRVPLQFFTWSFGANNKILLSTLQGRHRGIFAGVTGMIMAGYLGSMIRNPTYWEYMSTDEKLYKAIEYSGLTSYWLDINNIIEVMSMSEYGIRPQIFGKKNPFGETMGDAIAEPFGAGGSMIHNLIKLFSDESMSTREEVHAIKRLLPFNNIFYLRWLFNRAANKITDELKIDRF